MGKNEFITLRPKRGGRFEQFVAARHAKSQKMPKDPNKYVDAFVDKYGVDTVSNMQEVNIGDYVYEKGLVHAQNMNVGRNIPWIEDGLKAVERRVLYMMYMAKLYNGKFDKVAGVTGDMIKNVHPHGDQSAADTIYRLGRPRVAMIPYITPKGNYGNMEDMRPASPRYASASLSPYAMDCFFSEIGPKRPIYDVKDNYKYSGVEPIFLTSRYPNTLMQWNQGIGKGAASWLGAFNSRDLFKVAITMLDNPDCKVDIYPDTPVPIDIINKSELKGCFDMQKFKVKMRALYKIVDDKQRDEHGKIVDKHTVVFTSLPLTVSGNTVKNEIIAIRMADEKKANKRLPEVLNVEVVVSNDTPGGIEIIVSYEKGYDPEALAEKLFNCTSLGKTIGVQYMMITDNKPDLYTPREILKTWIMYRFDHKRRYYHQMALKAAKDRARLEALCKILESKDNTDRAIKIIRESKNDATALQELMKVFSFSEFQAYSVLQLKLKNLPKMNIDEIRDERDQALADYKKYRKLLTNDGAIKASIREELEDGLKKYGKERQANVFNLKDKGIGDPNEKKTIVYNSNIYFATLGDAELPNLKDRADKYCRQIQVQNSDRVLVVSKTGMIKVLDGYAFSNNTNGISISMLGLSDAIGIIPLTKDATSIVLISSSGYGKIVVIDEILKSTKSKITMFPDGDYAIAAIPINTTEGVIAMWSDSKMYCVKLEEFPILKRTAAGNRILKLAKDTLTGACYLPNDISHMIIYGEYGYMKAIPASVLKYSRKRPQVIDMDGKTIQGIIPLVDGQCKAKLYGWDGVHDVSVTVTKMVHIASVGTKEEYKFRLGTTIGAPVKVLKKGRNEYYQFVRK